MPDSAVEVHVYKSPHTLYPGLSLAALPCLPGSPHLLDGLFEVVVLHEVCVCHIELPHRVLTAEVCRRPEDPLHCTVVTKIPIDTGLGHET